ncbi:MAG: LPS-assembly protein LptD [Nitrospirae bacterium]|nr:LPS-assembly protein LptD [Nitrospirota bacterium]
MKIRKRQVKKCSNRGRTFFFNVCFVFCFLLLTSHFLLPTCSFAEGPADITADRLEYFSKTNTYIARGSVRIVFEDSALSADEAQLDGNTSDAVITGNAVYEDKETIITADKIELNLKTRLGVLYNSYVFYKKENFHLRGEKIIKTGDTSFLIDKASVTTCDADVPSWHFTGKDVKIRQHESLSAWGAKLNIKNTPVLYTPYFWAPLTRDRQTGLLSPSFGYSSTRGYYYKQGFFWAIKENQDATLYLDYYSEKDLAEGLDYRYILSPEVNGEFWVYHARDNEPSRDLYEIKSYHNQKLPYDISSYLKVHAVNEFDYYGTLDSTSSRRFGLSTWETDPFGFASEERLQKYLESNLHLSKPFTGGRTYLLAQSRQSLEGESNEIPQSLPEIAAVFNTVSRGPFSFNTSVKGVNFWRREGQKGQRYDINPNLYLSFGRLLNLTQKIGLRDTAYFLDEPSVSQNRFLYDLSTSLTTKLYKKYSSSVHIVEPFLEYEYVPSSNDVDIPVFDSTDTIQKTSSVNYSLTNRISGLTPLNLEARLRLSQSYSFLSVDKNFSPVLMESVLSSNNVALNVNASYDVDERRLSEEIASITLMGKTGYVTVGENYRRATALDQVTFEAGLYNPIKIGKMPLPLDLSTKLWYDLNGSGVQELDLNGRYTHQCWGLLFSYIKRPEEYQVTLVFELRGLGTMHLGSLSEATLNSF